MKRQRATVRKFHGLHKRFLTFDRELDRSLTKTSPRAAGFLDSISHVTNGSGTARQREKLRQSGAEAARLIRSRLISLEDRMRAACARCYVKDILKVLEDPRARQILRNAYFRDLILQSLLEIRQFVACRYGYHDEADRVAKLRKFWNDADKGNLASNRDQREALILRRQLHVYETLNPALTRKQRAQYEAELFKPLLDAVKNPECQLAAKKFRTKRWPARITEEGNLRADLAFFGVLGQLLSERFPDSDALMEMFDPVRHARLALLKSSKKALDKTNAKNLERNWRNLLDESHIVPRRQRKRGPRKEVRVTG